MKHALFALALCAGMASAGSAFAERWVAPINGTLSTIMLPDGDVMMKVQIPAKEFAAITGMMETKHNSCTVFHSTSQGDELNSLILVCGPNRQYIPNY